MAANTNSPPEVRQDSLKNPKMIADIKGGGRYASASLYICQSAPKGKNSVHTFFAWHMAHGTGLL
jgi:hypothetical protein